MINYKGEITHEDFQEHHLVDHDMDDVTIASITATAYDQHIEKRTDNAYCDHVYKNPINPVSDFASALNQRSEISKIMESIGSVTKK